MIFNLAQRLILTVKSLPPMKQYRVFILIVCLSTLMAQKPVFSQKNADDNLFIYYIVDTKKQDLKLYWKKDTNEIFGSIQNLKSWLAKHNKKLIFAMNGGMYKQDYSPLGLFIENKKIVSPLNINNGNGNFYMQPNGVFYIADNGFPAIKSTSNFTNIRQVKYATQSGPMLVIGGKINPVFMEKSTNLNIRNGVGILSDSKVLFAMSKREINFYEFAKFFKLFGCQNALYLDGFVSRTYLPEKNWIQTDGDFGVIIGVSKPN